MSGIVDHKRTGKAIQKKDKYTHSKIWTEETPEDHCWTEDNDGIEIRKSEMDGLKINEGFK